MSNAELADWTLGLLGVFVGVGSWAFCLWAIKQATNDTGRSTSLTGDAPTAAFRGIGELQRRERAASAAAANAPAAGAPPVR